MQRGVSFSLRADTLRALGQLESSAQTVDLDQNRVGRLSRMDALQGQAIAKASSVRQNDLLKNIELSLLKLELGTYGRCIECDDWIALGRLQLDPVVEYCIQFAQQLESS